MSSGTLPSVTMAVLGYNQEECISYAIDSALAQDYEGPLTLVFSDDCSSDGTFRIMQEKAAAYKGRHKIILNRNSENLKYAGNLLAALDKAPSALQCKQDGDDFSAPDRVSMLVQGFLCHPTAVYGVGQIREVVVASTAAVPNFAELSYAGDGACELLDSEDAEVVAGGCVSMWKAEVMEKIRTLYTAYKGIGEDELLCLIGRMYGDIFVVKKELVNYVLHLNNSSYVSKDFRYSSLRNFVETEQRLPGIWQQMVEWGRVRMQIGRRYLAEHEDIDATRRRKTEAFIRNYEGRLMGIERQREYALRIFPAKLWHWLQHRDAPLSCLCPSLLKGMIGCLLWRLRR